MRNSFRLWCVAACLFVTAACGGSSAPVAPSSAPAPAARAPIATPMFVVSSAVDFARCLQGAADAACVSGARIAARSDAAAAGITAPGAPMNLTTSSAGSAVTLRWAAPASGDPPTGYIIEAGSGPGLANLANFATGSTETAFSASGVGNGTYYVRVRAQNAAGVSAASNESTLVVGGGAGCTAAPNAPTAFAATVSGSTVSLSWTGPASGCAATSYVLQAGSSAGLSNLANSNVGNTTSYVATGVGNGTYYVRVRAQNAAGQSGPSNEIVVTVGGVDPGQGSLFTRSGSGTGSFTLPSTVTRVRITGTYTQSSPACTNFIVYIGFTAAVNEILGTCSIGSGSSVGVTTSTFGRQDVTIASGFGVAWTISEVR